MTLRPFGLRHYSLERAFYKTALLFLGQSRLHMHSLIAKTKTGRR